MNTLQPILTTSLFLISMTLSPFAFAQGADKGGHGGRSKYGDQFNFIGRKLGKELGSQLPINKILEERLSIRPTVESLQADDNSVDLLSYVENRNLGKATRTQPTLSLKASEIRVTEINIQAWNKMSCHSKHLLVLHEILVHARIEASQDYHVSSPSIDRLESEGKISCVGMPELFDIDYSGVKKGCPKNLVDGIIQGASELAKDAERLTKMYRSNFMFDSVRELDSSGVTVHLIEQSSKALAISYLARLCSDFIQSNSSSPILNEAMKKMKSSNQTMVMISLEAMGAIRDVTEPLVNLGLTYSQSVTKQVAYEGAIDQILVRVNSFDITNPFNGDADRWLYWNGILKITRVNVKVAQVGLNVKLRTNLYQIYYGSVYAAETAKTLVQTANEYKKGQEAESLF